MKPLSVLLLRTPVPPSVGTDAYHDTFGPFCLPSFSSSAVDSATSTPKSNYSRLSESPVAEESNVATLHEALCDITAQQTTSFTPTAPLDAWLMTHHKGWVDFSEREFCVTSFPVLAHRSVSVPKLSEIIAAQEDTYDGVIITSQRAVESWTEACLAAMPSLRARGVRESRWTSLPFYTVGPATSNSLRSARIAPVLAPGNVIGDENTGTGELLAHVIAQRSRSQHLLYLVGDKTSRGLTQTLSEIAPDVILERLMVYETCQDPKLGSHISLLARNLPGSSGPRTPTRPRASSNSSRYTVRPLVELVTQEPNGAPTPPLDANESPEFPDWIVFFSPSGGRYALPFLRERRWIGTNRAKIACIGPTTASWVRDELGFEPHAVASTPTPTALREAITNASANLCT